MLKRFLIAQMRFQKKNDWISQAQSDLKKLGLNDNLEKLKLMKKSKLERKLDKMIKEYAFQELNIKKDSHSKVKNIEHKRFEMQAYLTANNLKISQIEAQEIFKIRCRVTDVKVNFRGKYINFECEIYNENLEENQEDMLKC